MTALIRRLPTALLAVILGFATSSALAGGSHYHKGNTIVDKLIATKGAEALVAAVLLVNSPEFPVVDILSDKHERYTLFAPNNTAFEKLLELPEGFTKGKDAEELLVDLGTLNLDADAVIAILLDHVSSRKKTVNKLLRRGEVAVLGEERDNKLPVGIGATGVTVNHDSTIIKGDVWASNGIIHFIDTVIVVPTP